MAKRWRVGDCVLLADGRMGRIREVFGLKLRVRVRRTTSATHQFLTLEGKELKCANCPKGWMSRDGYARYLRTTLAKMRQRRARRAP